MNQFLVFATMSDLRRISVDTPDKTDVVIPLNKVMSAVGIDFDAKNDMIYWTDTDMNVIKRAHWNGSHEKVRGHNLKNRILYTHCILGNPAQYFIFCRY